MAAASYSSDVLERYYRRIDEAIQSLPRPLVPRFDGFQITQNNFHEWLVDCFLLQSRIPPSLRSIISAGLKTLLRKMKNTLTNETRTTTLLVCVKNKGNSEVKRS